MKNGKMPCCFKPTWRSATWQTVNHTARRGALEKVLDKACLTSTKERDRKENGSYTFLSERWGRLSISCWWPVRTAFGGRKGFIFFLNLYSLSYCQCCCHFPTYCVCSKFLGFLQKLPLLIITVDKQAWDSGELPTDDSTFYFFPASETNKQLVVSSLLFRMRRFTKVRTLVYPVFCNKSVTCNIWKNFEDIILTERKLG